MARTFQQLSKVVAGLTVTVDTYDMGLTLDGMPWVKVVAVCGSTTIEMSHTFGPTDGTQALPDPSAVQNMLDDLRQRVGKAAVHREYLKTQLAGAN